MDDINTFVQEDVIAHYGIKRRSGRYPWGSGEDPYQGDDEMSRRKRERWEAKQEKKANKEALRESKKETKREEARLVKQQKADEYKKKKLNKLAKADAINAVKNIRSLSTDELQTRVNRLQLEKQLRNLTEEMVTPGKKFVREFMLTEGKAVLKDVLTEGGKKLATRSIDEIYDKRKEERAKQKQKEDDTREEAKYQRDLKRNESEYQRDLARRVAEDEANYIRKRERNESEYQRDLARKEAEYQDNLRRKAEAAERKKVEEEANEPKHLKEPKSSEPAYTQREINASIRNIEKAGALMARNLARPFGEMRKQADLIRIATMDNQGSNSGPREVNRNKHTSFVDVDFTEVYEPKTMSTPVASLPSYSQYLLPEHKDKK